MTRLLLHPILRDRSSLLELRSGGRGGVLTTDETLEPVSVPVLAVHKPRAMGKGDICMFAHYALSSPFRCKA